MVRANAKGRHIVRKLPLPASAAGRHLPNWKTVHHLEKANQAAQLWRDDTLEAAGADGGEQPFINRGEMREDSHLQPHTVWRHFSAPRGLILTGKAWTKVIRCVFAREGCFEFQGLSGNLSFRVALDLWDQARPLLLQQEGQSPDSGTLCSTAWPLAPWEATQKFPLGIAHTCHVIFNNRCTCTSQRATLFSQLMFYVSSLLQKKQQNKRGLNVFSFGPHNKEYRVDNCV